MKRLLTILFILCLTCPVMAQQVTTNRLLKDVSDLCESVIDTNHSTMDIFVCLANAFYNPYVWRPGWSEKETVDVIKVIAAQKPLETITIKEEATYTPLIKNTMVNQFQGYVNQFRQYPQYRQNLTPELVKKFK